jgi:hypothetical protein
MSFDELRKSLLGRIAAGDGTPVQVTPADLGVSSQELREAFKSLKEDGSLAPSSHNFGPYDVNGIVSAKGKAAWAELNK